MSKTFDSENFLDDHIKTISEGASLGKYYSPKEIALSFDLSLSAVYGAIRRGSLAAHKVGGNWRISEEGLKSWLDS